MRAPLILVSVASALLAGSQAQAQAAYSHIPYSDETSRPPPSPSVREVAHESDAEIRERDRILGPSDDPNLGLAIEGLAGLFLLDSSKGALAEPQFAYGSRFTWEFGRVFANESIRNSFFGDVTWFRLKQVDGTQQVLNTTNYDLFSVAPAWAFPVNDAKTLGIYVQLGAGLCRQDSRISILGNSTELTGFKPLFQYGVGFRGTPVISASAPLRLSFRLELTRFRRGYMDDTFVGGSTGFDF